MIKNICSAILLACFGFPTASALPINDNFEDGALDTAIWSVSTPFGRSIVTEGGGRLSLVSRGGISTVDELPSAIEIHGGFKFTGSLDVFRVGFRSDLTTFSQYREPTGTFVWFDQERNTVGIAEAGIRPIASTPFSFGLNTEYTFRIVDDGNLISLYLNGSSSALVSAASSYSAGNHGIIYNREISGASVSLDFLQIQGNDPGTNVSENLPWWMDTLIIGTLGIPAIWLRRT